MFVIPGIYIIFKIPPFCGVRVVAPAFAGADAEFVGDVDAEDWAQPIAVKSKIIVKIIHDNTFLLSDINSPTKK
jgi:hypothetical protein